MLDRKKVATCKRIGYEFFCEELFCSETQIYTQLQKCNIFDLDKLIITQNCDFIFYYSKTDITPTVLDGGNKIILAN